MLCLHCSPPTSDPRGTRAEGTAQFTHRHRLGPQGSPVALRRSMAAAGQLPKSRQEATEGSPAHPRRPANRDTRAAGTVPATAQVRKQRPSGTLAEEPDEYDPHPRQASRERPAERQPRAHDSDDRTT